MLLILNWEFLGNTAPWVFGSFISIRRGRRARLRGLLVDMAGMCGENWTTTKCCHFQEYKSSFLKRRAAWERIFLVSNAYMLGLGGWGVAQGNVPRGTTGKINFFKIPVEVRQSAAGLDHPNVKEIHGIRRKHLFGLVFSHHLIGLYWDEGRAKPWAEFPLIFGPTSLGWEGCCFTVFPTPWVHSFFCRFFKKYYVEQPIIKHIRSPSRAP